MKWGGVKRSVRVGDLVHKEIAGLLHKGIKDPRLDGVSITGVDLTDDLSSGVLFFQVRGDENRRRQVMAGFKSAHSFLRAHLRKVLYIRVIPRLEFQYDLTLDRAARVEELLKRIHEEPGGISDGATQEEEREPGPCETGGRADED